MLLFPLLVFAGCDAPPTASGPSLHGPGWALETTDAGLVYSRAGDALFTLDQAAFQLGVIRAFDARASYDPWWLDVDDGFFTRAPPPGFGWRAAETMTVRANDAGTSLQLALGYPRDLTATVDATVGDAGELRLRFVPTRADSVAYLRVRTSGLTADEALYGLGEWFDGLNHRGKVRPLQLEASLALESGNTENHVSVPFLTSSRGWGVFVETTRHGVVDVAKADPAVVDWRFGTAEASAEGLTLHVFSAAAPLDVSAQYFAVTGAPALPAPWALGPWLWRNEDRDQAELESDVQTLRALSLATSGVWLDRPYATEVNTFDFDAAKFPDAGAMLRTIADEGLALALWHTPYLASGAAPFRAEAEAAGYFPPGTGTMLNRWSAPVDLTQPAARTWWQAHVEAYVQQGVQGFKLDFAEDVAAGLSGQRSGWTFADGQTDRTMTDGFTRRYHDVYRAALGEAPGFLLVRHAQWGEHTRAVVVWPGDIDATLTRFAAPFTDRDGRQVASGVGGLPSALHAGVGLSVSGFPLFASDTGGYLHSPPDKETFLRWVEHSALMPVMQTGDASSQPPWLFTPENGRDAEALDTYRAFASLHLRLFPFFWTGLMAQTRGARPVVRPFGLQFPELGQHPDDEYLLGDALLVAPVVTRGATQRQLIKPPGRWFSFFDGGELPGAAGDLVTVSTGLTELPLFLREGALVPMLEPSVVTLRSAVDPAVRAFGNQPGMLWVRAQPGDGRFTVYDGTELTQTGQTLSARPGSTFTGAVVWELRGVPAVTSVTHDGAPVPQVSDLALAPAGYTFSGGVLRIKDPADAKPTTWR